MREIYEHEWLVQRITDFVFPLIVFAVIFPLSWIVHDIRKARAENEKVNVKKLIKKFLIVSLSIAFIIGLIFVRSLETGFFDTPWWYEALPENSPFP